MQKLETQFLNKNSNNNIFIIKIPQIKICNISKIYCIKYKNESVYKYPMIEKNEYITKTIKDIKAINSIIFLQKFISKYFNDKKDINKNFSYNFNKPNILNYYI